MITVDHIFLALVWWFTFISLVWLIVCAWLKEPQLSPINSVTLKMQINTDTKYSVCISFKVVFGVVSPRGDLVYMKLTWLTGRLQYTHTVLYRRPLLTDFYLYFRRWKPSHGVFYILLFQKHEHITGVSLRPNYQPASNFKNWPARIEFNWPKQYWRNNQT